MMPLEEAKTFAEANFPRGVELLAARLGIEVCELPLRGCDGWVLSGPQGIRIRINKTLSTARRRFTLAHELGHLLLGIPTLVGETIAESLRSDQTEERAVNDLASELLMPDSVVRRFIPGVPVVAEALRKLAKAALVSDLAAAIRVANLAQQIGLSNASVVFFKNDQFEWQWSRTLRLPPAIAAALLRQVKASHPVPVRIPKSKTDDMLIASMIENRDLNSIALFVQLLPGDVGKQLSIQERRKELEAFLFGNESSFRNQLQGCLSACKIPLSQLKPNEAAKEFFSRYEDRWSGTANARLRSAKGREYIELRFSEWCNNS